MSHDYNYRVGGTALVPTYAEYVRLAEGVAGRRAEHVPVAYRDGVYVAARTFTDQRLMRLDTLLPGSSAAATYAALHGIKGLLMGGQVLLQRNDPHLGEVRSLVTVDSPSQQQEGPDRFMYRWPVWQLRGHWEAATASTDQEVGLGTTGTVGPLAVAGDHPTYPKFTITCTADGANPALEDQATGDRVSLPTACTAGDVLVVDCYEHEVTLNGVRATNLFDPNRAWWMLWEPGTVTLDWTASSGTWTVDTEWRSRWR